MKNHILFFVGIALLVLTVWVTTMVGIKLNDNKASTSFGVFAEEKQMHGENNITQQV